VATIYTLPPINVTNTSATFQFEVENDGNATGSESWIAAIGYKLHSSSEWIWSENIYGSGEGSYQQDVTGLTPYSQYDVTSRILNSIGLSFGDIETFWTEFQLGLPAVSTMRAQNITSSSAQLELLLNDDGDPSAGAQVNTRFIFWQSGQPQLMTEWLAVEEGQQSKVTVSGLQSDTIYSFYAQAKNSVGQVNGNTLNFKTFADPNICPSVFDTNEPNTLIIQNHIKVFQNDPNKPHSNQGLFTYVEGIGLNEIDSNDVLYSVPAFAVESKIVSLIFGQSKKGQNPVPYELAKDARPDNAQNALLELSIFSPEPSDPNISSENSLKFWLAKNAFQGKAITIQKISSDPNIIYPVWDVNEIISKNGRKMPLNNLVNQQVNKSYGWLILSTSREIIDINGNGIIEISDYQILLKDVGKTGIFRSDIASLKNKEIVPGIPDGKVNSLDVMAFITEYNRRSPANPIPNPYAEVSEDFESGGIQEPFTTSENSPWGIDSNPCSGNYCAKSGNIGDTQTSVLEADIDTMSEKISFCVKVSCEAEYDNLTFYIDDVETGKWSGQKDWQKVDFQTTPGTHNFKWIYKKDFSASEGEDAAWIDEIEFSMN
jgi:hypothetical protein